MKFKFICLLCLSLIFLFSSCIADTQNAPPPKTSVAFSTEGTTQHSTIEEETHLQTSSASEQTPTQITWTDDDLIPFEIGCIQGWDMLLIRWGDVIENNRYSYPVQYDYINNKPIYEIDLIAVKIEIVDMLSIKNQYLSYETLKWVWIPVSELDRVTKGECAIILPFSIDLDNKIGVISPDLAVNHNYTTNIIPITDGKLQLQKDETQIWSNEIKVLFDFNRWAKESGIDVPVFEDGMALSQFKETIQYILTYR